MAEDKKKCFVIMPFSQTSEKHTEQYWTEHFEDFLKPLIEELPHIEANRSKPLSGDIIKEIITNLMVSPLVVADLTDLNPNVFWELGVRQSFRHRTVTIAQEGTKLPFDIFSKGTLFYYPDNHVKNAKFCGDFKKATKSCLDAKLVADSSVLETLSGRGTLYEIVHQAETIRRVDALLEENSYNLLVLKETESIIKYNKENPSDLKYMTDRFMSACIELLLTNRYLEEEKSFYELVRLVFSSVDALNDQLRAKREDWFEKNNKLYFERFEEFRRVLEEINKKLMERIPTSL